ncbi:tyrosine-protein phosphatase 10D-like [Amphiura filiformis]|uniref:tyrosine-protein phosphatase 10D-like n=1 Tax=Amphiura filiformis TaxID=82378 RepID=UPI003B222CAD
MFTNVKSGAMYVVKMITMRNGFMDSEPVAFKVSTYPDSPTKIHIISLSDRQMTLQWSGTPCDGCNVDFYYIDKVSDAGEVLHNDGVSCSPSANGQEKICTKSFKNLHPGHLYTFSVTAVSFGLRSQRPFVYQQRTKPGIPGDITFNLIDKWRVILSWFAAEGLVDSYIVNIRSGKGNVDESREIPYNRRRLDFTNLRPGRPYTISIIANVDGLVSNARSIVVHTLPDIPTRVENFLVKAISPVEVLATFSEPKQPNGIIEAYHISYYGSTSLGKPCPSVLDRRLPGTSTKVVIGDLYAGCNYTLTIAASTGAGKGSPVTQYVRTPIGAPKATGRQPGVPPSNAIHRNSFTVTFDTTFFDEAYGDIQSYAILVAESTTINSHTVDSKNITTPPVMMTWAEAFEYDIIPRYQIDELYHYAELFEGDTHYARRKREAARGKREAVYSRDIHIGKEKCSKTDKTEFCNGPLKSGRTYVYQFRGFSSNGYSDTEFSPPIQLPSDQTGLIVGISVVLVVLFIIVLVLAVLVIGRRWKYVPYRGKYMLANTSEPLTSGTMNSKGSRASKIKFSRPVLLSEFCQDYHTMNAHSHYGFSQEYETIRKVGNKKNCNAAVLADNVSKNRYTNILPYDKTRVKLSSIDDDEGSDYINANYIPGFNSPREFIACQGPLPGTTDDTWKMIWEHNVATVVMVTQLVEKGKVKCDQYWPEDHKPVMYGDVQVTMTSSTEQQDWNVREFTLQKAENTKKVRHLNYVSWPDHGVPESSDVLLSFIKFVRQQIPRNGTPTIVHCSAGVGRTGTFICLDRILHHIEDFDFVDIMAFVSEMRMHRNYMVQTEQQYVFIHRCVLDILEEKGIAPKQTPSSINGDAAEHSCKV